jgi:E3 ubiquitin-protein ligase mind-bomb
VSDTAGPSGVNPPPPEIPGDVCVVCEDAKRTTLFLPCAHIATCDLCALKILNAGALCCICRTPIEKVLRPKFA